MRQAGKLLVLTASLLLLSLTAAGLAVDEPRTGLPDPWNLDSSTFRPGEVLLVEANVTDGTPSSVNLTIDGPGLTDTVSMDGEEDYTRQYRLPSDASEGVWTANVTADSTWNSTSFTVSRLETSTLRINRSTRAGEEVYVDGQNVTDGVFTSLSFPYGIGVADEVMMGVIGYGRVDRLGYSSNGGTVFNVTQAMDDTVTLLPIASLSVPELEQLEGRFNAGSSGANSFLDPGRVAFGHDFDAEKRITVTLDYRDSDEVILRGFNGSLASGLYELEITNDGSQDGRSIVSIRR